MKEVRIFDTQKEAYLSGSPVKVNERCTIQRVDGKNYIVRKEAKRPTYKAFALPTSTKTLQMTLAEFQTALAVHDSEGMDANNYIGRCYRSSGATDENGVTLPIKEQIAQGVAILYTVYFSLKPGLDLEAIDRQDPINYFITGFDCSVKESYSLEDEVIVKVITTETL